MLVGMLLSLHGAAMLQLMGVRAPPNVDVYPTTVQQVGL